MGLILLNAILMGMKDYLDTENKNPINKFIKMSDPYFNFFIYFEFILKSIALGLSADEKGFFGDTWNWLDFFVVIITAINDILPLIVGNHGGGGGMKSLRSVRLMRPLKLLRGIPSIRILISTLLSSVGSLGGIMGIAMFVFLIFGILGVTFWEGKIHYRCYLGDQPPEGLDWVLTPDHTSLCSSYSLCPSGSFCGSRYDQYLKMKNQSEESVANVIIADLWSDTDIEELNYGLSNFDNVGNAFLTIFQCTTMDGWTNVMAIHEDIFAPWFVQIYFVLVIVVCSFFVLNLTIALMLLKYEQANSDNTAQASHDSEERDIFSRELHKLGEFIFTKPEHHEIIDFIVDTDGIQIDKGVFKELKASKGFWESLFSSEKYNLDRDHDYYQSNHVKDCLSIIEHKYFNGVIMMVIVANTACLAIDTYRPPDVPKYPILKNLNLAFTGIFTFECYVKLKGLGLKEYTSVPFNLFDFVTVTLSLVQLALERQGVHGNSAIFSIMRSFRVFRIFKLFKTGGLRLLLDSIIYTLSTIGSYIVLVSFFLYIAALFGMSSFAGKVRFNEDGFPDPNGTVIPRENFDTLASSIIVIFEVLTYTWTDTMFGVMRCIGTSASFYYVSLVIMGSIVLMNLFLAIMLGNFDKARFYQMKMEIFKAFQELMIDRDESKGEYKYDISEACDIIFGDLSAHVKYRVLMFYNPEDQQKAIDKQRKKESRAAAYEAKDHEGKERMKEKEQRLKRVEEYKQRVAWFVRNARKNMIEVKLKKEEEKLAEIERLARMIEGDIDELNTPSQNAELDDNKSQKSQLERSQVNNTNDDGTLMTPVQLFIECFSRATRQAMGNEAKTPDPMANNNDGYFWNASLGIFHIDSGLRRLCLELAEPFVSYEKFVICRERHLHERRERKYGVTIPTQETFVKKRLIGLNSAFDAIILILIIFSSLMLPLDSPLNDPEGDLAKKLAHIGIVFTVCFLTELIIKIIAKGFYSNQLTIQLENEAKKQSLEIIEPYFSSGWNRVDFFVVCISVFDLAMYLLNIDSDIAFLKALRALRALRPLRVVNKFPNLRIVVNALFSIFAAVSNVVIVGGLFLLIFAIMGAGFFKGKFSTCASLPDDYDTSEYPSSEIDCKAAGGEWENKDQNFDNLHQAFLTLFVMMTGDDWNFVMWDGIDATPIGEPPQRDIGYNQRYFFMAYMIVGSIFVQNLFVGVVIDSFNRIKEKEEMGGTFLTENQREWITCVQITQSAKMVRKAERPEEFWRLKAYEMTEDETFNNFIMATIALNTFVMASNSYPGNENLELVFGFLNKIFAIVFNFEMFVKLYALREEYFNIPANLFDMFIVVSSDLGTIITLLGMSGGLSSAVTILRAFRMLRILRLLKRNKEVQVILQALVGIIPKVMNVMSLFVLALYIFSCISLNLFAKVKFGDAIDDKFNFQTLGGAMITLMRFATGDGWSEYMFELGSQQEGCVQSQTYEEFKADGAQVCGSKLAIPFLLLFMVLVEMLILNLTVAAVIDGLNTSMADAGRPLKIADFISFSEAWSKYDPEKNGMIRQDQLFFLITELSHPFKDYSHLVERWTTEKEPPENGTLWLYDTEEKRRVRISDLIKIFLKLQFKVVQNKYNHFDKTYYIKFEEVKRIMLKNLFIECNRTDFKVENKEFNAKLKKGWNQKTKKFQENREFKNLLVQKLAVALIEAKFRQKKKHQAQQMWRLAAGSKLESQRNLQSHNFSKSAAKNLNNQEKLSQKSKIGQDRQMHPLSISKKVFSLDVLDRGSSVSQTRPLARLQQSSNLLDCEILPNQRINLESVMPQIESNSGSFDVSIPQQKFDDVLYQSHSEESNIRRVQNQNQTSNTDIRVNKFNRQFDMVQSFDNQLPLERLQGNIDFRSPGITSVPQLNTQQQVSQVKNRQYKPVLNSRPDEQSELTQKAIKDLRNDPKRVIKRRELRQNIQFMNSKDQSKLNSKLNNYNTGNNSTINNSTNRLVDMGSVRQTPDRIAYQYPDQLPQEIITTFSAGPGQQEKLEPEILETVPEHHLFESQPNYVDQYYRSRSRQKDSSKVAELKSKRKRVVDQVIKNQKKILSQSHIGQLNMLNKLNQAFPIEQAPNLRISTQRTDNLPNQMKAYDLVQKAQSLDVTLLEQIESPESRFDQKKKKVRGIQKLPVALPQKTTSALLEQHSYLQNKLVQLQLSQDQLQRDIQQAQLLQESMGSIASGPLSSQGLRKNRKKEDQHYIEISSQNQDNQSQEQYWSSQASQDVSLMQQLQIERNQSILDARKKIKGNQEQKVLDARIQRKVDKQRKMVDDVSRGSKKVQSRSSTKSIKQSSKSPRSSNKRNLEKMMNKNRTPNRQVDLYNRQGQKMNSKQQYQQYSAEKHMQAKQQYQSQTNMMYAKKTIQDDWGDFSQERDQMYQDQSPGSNIEQQQQLNPYRNMSLSQQDLHQKILQRERSSLYINTHKNDQNYKHTYPGSQINSPQSTQRQYQQQEQPRHFQTKTSIKGQKVQMQGQLQFKQEKFMQKQPRNNLNPLNDQNQLLSPPQNMFSPSLDPKNNQRQYAQYNLRSNTNQVGTYPLNQAPQSINQRGARNQYSHILDTEQEQMEEEIARKFRR